MYYNTYMPKLPEKAKKPIDSHGGLRTNTPILTANGWKNLADIQVGDKVYGSDGTLVNVTTVEAPYTSEELYKVAFTNGDYLYVDKAQKWLVNHISSEKVEAPQLDNQRVEEISGKEVLLVVNDRTIALEKTEIGQALPAEIIYNTISLLPTQFEDINCVVVDLNIFVEHLYVEMSGRKARWSTQQIFERTKESETALFSLELPKPLILPPNELPVPVGVYADWLINGNDAISGTRAEELQSAGIENNEQIAEPFLYANVNQRRNLLNALTDGNRKSSLFSYSAKFVDDAAFLASSLGYDAYAFGSKNTPGAEKKLKVVQSATEAPYIVKFFFDETHMNIYNPTSAHPNTVRLISVSAEDGLFLAGRRLIPVLGR
jgi:hypothetical protein